MNCLFCQKQLTDQKTIHHPYTISEGRCEDCRAEFIEGDEDERLLSYSFDIDYKDKKFLFSAIVQPFTGFQIYAQPPVRIIAPRLTVSDITNYQTIIVLQIVGDPPANLTPQNAAQKLSLWMTFS